MNCTCCVKLFWAEGYNSITWHNQLLVDYSKGESESKGIYEDNLTDTDIQYTYIDQS